MILTSFSPVAVHCVWN